jgi:ATP-dependent RNA helicase RhlE
MKFDDYYISSEIKKNLSKLGLKRPTDIQYKSIPHILKGEDVLAIAQTGTGKTAAFAIPVLNMLHENKARQRREDGIKCIVMVPTRELALQITEVFQHIGKHTNLEIFCVFGGVEQDKQISKLQDGVDILVVTPGRMFDLVSQGHIRLNRVTTLILDEADHMLDLGFIKDIRDLIKFLPPRRQTLFFSATINKEIKQLAYSLVSKPIRIQVSPKNPVAKTVDHSIAFVEMDDKRFFLERILKDHPESKVLVFVRTKVRAERVCKAMERAEIKSETIHGGKDQLERFGVMDRFKSGENRVLIATDVSARGIDVPNVDYVINYDMPEVVENYVHRCGRTGRGKLKGIAVSFCSSEEKDILLDIEDYLGKSVNIMTINKSEYTDVVEFGNDQAHDWKYLMKNEENEANFLKEQKKRKKKKKK